MLPGAALASSSGPSTSLGSITVKKVFENRCTRWSIATAMFATAFVNASIWLSTLIGSQFALERMKPCSQPSPTQSALFAPPFT